MSSASCPVSYSMMLLLKLARFCFSFDSTPVKVNMTYYRDSNAKEIDLLIEENNSIHPVEIKKSASPDSREIRKFAIIDKTEFEHGMGGIICMCNDVIPIDRLNLYIPFNVI